MAGREPGFDNRLKARKEAAQLAGEREVLTFLRNLNEFYTVAGSESINDFGDQMVGS